MPGVGAVVATWDCPVATDCRRLWEPAGRPVVDHLDVGGTPPLEGLLPVKLSFAREYDAGMLSPLGRAAPRDRSLPTPGGAIGTCTCMLPSDSPQAGQAVGLSSIAV